MYWAALDGSTPNCSRTFRYVLFLGFFCSSLIIFLTCSAPTQTATNSSLSTSFNASVHYMYCIKTYLVLRLSVWVLKQNISSTSATQNKDPSSPSPAISVKLFCIHLLGRNSFQEGTRWNWYRKLSLPAEVYLFDVVLQTKSVAICYKHTSNTNSWTFLKTVHIFDPAISFSTGQLVPRRHAFKTSWAVFSCSRLQLCLSVH